MNQRKFNYEMQATTDCIFTLGKNGDGLALGMQRIASFMQTLF